MAAGGSDPCTGSTVRISRARRASGAASHSWPGKIGAGRGDYGLRIPTSQGSRFLASRVLFVASQAAPSPLGYIHALGRVKLRQSVGSIIHGKRWLEACHPKSPFSGNTPPLPGIAQIKSRHGPGAGTRAVWPWEHHRRARPPGLQASLPEAQTSTNTPSTRQDNSSHHPSPITHPKKPRYGRGCVGKERAWTASATCTAPASSSSPPFFPLSCPVPSAKCCLDDAVGKFEKCPSLAHTSPALFRRMNRSLAAMQGSQVSLF